MKTKEECLVLAIARHPKGAKNGMKHDEYSQVVFEAALTAIEMFHSQFSISDSEIEKDRLYTKEDLKKAFHRDGSEFRQCFCGSVEFVKTPTGYICNRCGQDAVINKTFEDFLATLQPLPSPPKI